MPKYIFIVLAPNDEIIWTLGENHPSSLLNTAHGLVDQFHMCSADRCEIWAQTDGNSMTLLATAF